MKNVKPATPPPPPPKKEVTIRHEVVLSGPCCTDTSCVHCHGTGFIESHECDACKGHGSPMGCGECGL